MCGHLLKRGYEVAELGAVLASVVGGATSVAAELCVIPSVGEVPAALQAWPCCRTFVCMAYIFKGPTNCSISGAFASLRHFKSNPMLLLRLGREASDPASCVGCC